MSDDRLFASNNPIGRKWYFINLIILSIIFILTLFVFPTYIIPNTKTEIYYLISKIIMYFLYLIYLVTFFSLIDRRLYDITGNRDSIFYILISRLMTFIIFYEIFIAINHLIPLKIPVYYMSLLYEIAGYLIIIFTLITVLIGFFKGKISGQTYKEYRNRIKYQ